jgi:hypothetical protein
VLSPDILAELRAAAGPQGLVSSPDDLRTYDADGLTNFRATPLAVCLPRTTGQVQPRLDWFASLSHLILKRERGFTKRSHPSIVLRSAILSAVFKRNSRTVARPGALSASTTLALNRK